MSKIDQDSTANTRDFIHRSDKNNKETAYRISVVKNETNLWLNRIFPNGNSPEFSNRVLVEIFYPLRLSKS